MLKMSAVTRGELVCRAARSVESIMTSAKACAMEATFGHKAVFDPGGEGGWSTEGREDERVLRMVNGEVEASEASRRAERSRTVVAQGSSKPSFKGVRTQRAL